MNEDKLMQLLNSLDDDLVEKEINKLLEGVEIDMNAINKKAHQKLGRKNKKIFTRKKLTYVAAACLCILSITAIYADDISQTIKSFFNKTPIYSTVVDGEAYYLKEPHSLNDYITLESIMVHEGKLEMELTTDLEIEDELANISIIPKNNPSVVYYLGGYGKVSEEKNRYLFSFMNGVEENYHIKPFKDFIFNITGNTYEVSLDKAKSLDLNSNIYTANAAEKRVAGVNIGAKILEESEKLNIQLITSFEDKDLKLAALGKLKETNFSSTFENLGEKGLIGSSTALMTEDLYVSDETGKEYKLEIPKNPTGRPVTIFETNAPKDKNLTLEIPTIVVSYHEVVDSFSFNIPDEGEVNLNQEIDFRIQKAIVKKIKRLTATKAEVEFQLNTGENENAHIKSFSFYSPDIRKMAVEFNKDKAIMTLEFDENLTAADMEISYPNIEMNGNWAIDIE
ncbi:hypothetical protein CACET_c38710 [Clostridium aceticum]|uniref:Uncharacterized protein n=1 Tax=Clostridium aceticum TaxID=84022 RepID=A0A0D8I8F2_9CLOT|nr:hypothetical protein [Clostridium aceticum]AKL97299.1 hypothetical protein CACET_c38710 [Clostridium aceticum]KJF26317.1 hypothetical protein TZ02_14210 [Clostridium aceticum]